MNAKKMQWKTNEMMLQMQAQFWHFGWKWSMQQWISCEISVIIKIFALIVVAFVADRRIVIAAIVCVCVCKRGRFKGVN